MDNREFQLVKKRNKELQRKVLFESDKLISF